jgi:hypothetical protein
MDPVIYVESHTFGTAQTPVLDVVMLARAEEGVVMPSPEEVERADWLTCDEMLLHPLVQPWTKSSLQRAETLRHQLGW